MENNKPIHEIRFGVITASIWDNSKDEKPYYSVTVSRLYKAGDGNWKRSNSFVTSELLLVAKVIDQAHTYIHTELFARERSG